MHRSGRRGRAQQPGRGYAHRGASVWKTGFCVTLNWQWGRAALPLCRCRRGPGRQAEQGCPGDPAVGCAPARNNRHCGKEWGSGVCGIEVARLREQRVPAGIQDAARHWRARRVSRQLCECARSVARIHPSCGTSRAWQSQADCGQARAHPAGAWARVAALAAVRAASRATKISLIARRASLEVGLFRLLLGQKESKRPEHVSTGHVGCGLAWRCPPRRVAPGAAHTNLVPAA